MFQGLWTRPHSTSWASRLTPIAMTPCGAEMSRPTEAVVDGWLLAILPSVVAEK